MSVAQKRNDSLLVIRVTSQCSVEKVAWYHGTPLKLIFLSIVQIDAANETPDAICLPRCFRIGNVFLYTDHFYISRENNRWLIMAGKRDTHSAALPC